jgi:hypothetical protein
MSELNEQVHIEDHTLGDGPDGAANEPVRLDLPLRWVFVCLT